MALDPAQYHALLRLLNPNTFDSPEKFTLLQNRVKNIRDIAKELKIAVENSSKLPEAIVESAMNLLIDDPEDKQLIEFFNKTVKNRNKREQLYEQLINALKERHGFSNYVIRNRRGPVGGLPSRKPVIIPLTATPKQEILIDVGESVIFELVETIQDEDSRYQQMATMLKALWATPGALLSIAKQVSPVLVNQLSPHVKDVVESSLDDDHLPKEDARLRWLIKYIRENSDDKILVFVESPIAVQALSESLKIILECDIAMFHRQLSARDQDRQVAWFRDPAGPQIMLSTEAGGEGRNFQFCNIVVLYDLPWRPATIEQRIGRIDRVGQQKDVTILVPYFSNGFEAAILKVMQQSIGVLNHTVGGIDHALEFVNSKLAELIYYGDGAEEWKKLYQETEKLVTQSRKRITQSNDAILDHASFSKARVQKIFDKIPTDFEEQVKEFVTGYAEHNKLNIKTRTETLVAVEGAPGAAGENSLTGYMATFNREYALDHEEIEFISIGHPLVDQAIEWAKENDNNSASMAMCRGFDKESALFLWSFALDIPDTAPELITWFDTMFFTAALDERGRHKAEYDNLLTASHTMDRIDASPLKNMLPQWHKLVENSYNQAIKLAEQQSSTAIEKAMQKLSSDLLLKEKQLKRKHVRERWQADQNNNSDDIEAIHTREITQFEKEQRRLYTALKNVRPRLQTVVTVKLMKAKEVSG